MTFLVFLDRHLTALLLAGGTSLLVLLIFIDSWLANYFQCRAIEAHLKAGGRLVDAEDDEEGQ